MVSIVVEQDVRFLCVVFPCITGFIMENWEIVDWDDQHEQFYEVKSFFTLH